MNMNTQPHTSKERRPQWAMTLVIGSILVLAAGAVPRAQVIAGQAVDVGHAVVGVRMTQIAQHVIELTPNVPACGGGSPCTSGTNVPPVEGPGEVSVSCTTPGPMVVPGPPPESLR